MFVLTNTWRQLCVIMLAGAPRDCVTDACGSLLNMNAGFDADQVAAEDVIVDARSELRRRLQEMGSSCICRGATHVSLIPLNGRTCAYLLFCSMEDLLRFNNLNGLSG